MPEPSTLPGRSPRERFWRAFALTALFFLSVALGLLHRPGHLLEWSPRQAVHATPAYPVELARVTLVVAGDIIPHGNVKKAAAEAQAVAEAQAKIQNVLASPSVGWKSLLSEVSDLFRGADFGFVNLETPVSPESSRGSAPYVFDAPPELLDALTHSGIQIVSFANNHVFDQGQKGFEESLNHLKEKGISLSGAGSSESAAWEPVIVEKNGIRVGFLAMTRWLNGNRNPEKATLPHVAFLPYSDDKTPGGVTPESVLKAVTAAKQRCDFLFVSIHWGTEYAPEPREEDRKLGAEILEAGADVLLGHHPHVLQPIETRLTKEGRTGLIFYSFGNFLSNQAREYLQGVTPEKTGEMRDSVVASVSIVRRDYGKGVIRVELGPVGIFPAWTDNTTLRSEAGAGEHLVIGPVLIDRELPVAKARLSELLAPGASGDPTPQELVQVASRVALLTRRRELILARLGSTYLAEPPRRDASGVQTVDGRRLTARSCRGGASLSLRAGKA